MHLTAGILTHNDNKYLIRCLETLVAQEDLGTLGTDWQIVVIDNASSDIEYLMDAKQKFPGVRFVLERENMGFAKGHNEIIRRFPADFHAVLNNDILFERSYLSLLVETLAQNPDAGSATGKLLKWDYENDTKTNVIDTVGIEVTKSLRFYDLGQGEEDRGQYYEACERFGASGAAAVYRRSALEKVSLDTSLLGLRPRYGTTRDDITAFDESFFMYKEDCDLAYRLHMNGIRCMYVPAARAWHDRTAAKDIRRRDRSVLERAYSAANQTRILRKHRNNVPLSQRFRLMLDEYSRWTFLLLFEPRTFFTARAVLSAPR